MSQYPSPYSQPPYFQPPMDFSQYMPTGQADLLGPARRAGMLMIVIGALIAIFGVCNAGSAITTTPDDMAQQQAAFQAAGLPQSPIPLEKMRIAAGVVAAVMVVVGVACIASGVHVRRGSGKAIAIALVLAVGLTAIVGLFFILCLISIAVAPPVAVFACVLTIPLALLIWLDIWLGIAARNLGQINAARQLYQSQFQQYQQQQQAYGTPLPPQGQYAPYAPYAPGTAWSNQYAPPPPTAPQPQSPQPPQQKPADPGDPHGPGAA